MNALYLWTNGDSVTTLAETIEIEGYGCALFDVHGQLKEASPSKPYYLCSDISDDVFVNNIKLPVLRQLKLNSKGFVTNEIEKPIWITVTRRSISKIRLYLCDDEGNIFSFKGRGLYCTLLLVPHKGS